LETNLPLPNKKKEREGTKVRGSKGRITADGEKKRVRKKRGPS